jgi:hypothetical protein
MHMFRKKSKLTIDSKETYIEIGAEIFGIIFSLFGALVGLAFLWTGIRQDDLGAEVFGLFLTPILILVAGLLIKEVVDWCATAPLSYDRHSEYSTSLIDYQS